MNQKLLVPISLLASAAITFPALAQVTYPDDTTTDTSTTTGDTRPTGQGATTDIDDELLMDDSSDVGGAMDSGDDTTPTELPSTGGGGMAR